MKTTTNRRKLDSSFRNDSLSSDQSECLQQQRPPPPKPHKHKQKGMAGSNGQSASQSNSASQQSLTSQQQVQQYQSSQQREHQQRQAPHQNVYSSGPRPFGVSSSDEEIRSTPECTSCGEEEMESESVSEKGRPPFISGSHFSFFLIF